MKGHIVGKVATSIMMDTGATHNFISKGEVKKLGLKLEKDSGRMKVVNFKAFYYCESDETSNGEA